MQERPKPNRRSKKNTNQQELTPQEPTKANDNQSFAGAQNSRKKASQSTAPNDEATAERNQLIVPNITKPEESNQKSKSSKSETKSAVPWYLQE